MYKCEKEQIVIVTRPSGGSVAGGHNLASSKYFGGRGSCHGHHAQLAGRLSNTARPAFV